MAIKTWWMGSGEAVPRVTTLLNGPCHMSETDPGAEAYASPATGWVVGTTGAGNYSILLSTTERTAGTFVGSVVPAASPSAGGAEALRTSRPYTGSFAAGTWTFHCAVRAQTAGGAHDGRIGLRLRRAKRGTMSSSIEITSARQVGSEVTNLATGATQISTVSFALPAFSLDDEYLFVQIAWEITGAGGTATDDVNLRVGTNATRLISPDFTEADPAGLTWWMTNNLAGPHQEVSETSPGADAFASPVTGWVVGTVGTGNYSQFRAQTEQAMTTFSATVRPDGTINAVAGDCLRTEERYFGTFAAGDWTIRAILRSQTGSATSTYAPAYRVFRGTQADGSDAFEITSSATSGGTVVSLRTSEDYESAAIINLPAFEANGEYLFFQVGWRNFGASGGATDDVNFKIGDLSTRIISTELNTATPLYKWVRGTLPGWFFAGST